MLKFLLVALLAVAVSATGEEHDAAIAEVAQEMPEHAVAFAELAAAAGTDDVFTVLDAISSNIEAERKHAESFYKSYKKTTQRDLKKYNLLVAKLAAHERRNKGMTEAERKEIKQLRRAVNANVRSLSRAVERFQHVQQQEKRTTYKKKAAMRHLNNKIADRKTFLKVLRVIRKALQSDKPVAARFIEALSVAQSHGLNAGSDNVLLQISSEEAIGQETDNSDEVAADAEVDHEAFEMDSMPSADELTLMDEGEDEAEEEEEDESEVESEDTEEEVSEDAADAALDAADASEEEEVEEAESAEDSESSAEDEAEADAEAEDEVDEAGQARMMQVLEKLATGARDDDSVADLLALIDSLIADVKESIAGAKKRKVAVLAKYTAQMKNLQQLANSIKASIRRLQAVVQTGRARVAELEQSTHAVDANTKENDAQLKAYRSMRKGIKSNWSKYEARYNKNQAKRTKQLEQLAELKRRLAAVERTKGALSVDLSKVNLRYRWKAGPFGGCQAPCGPSTRTRKVQCLSFSGKPVKHTFCEGQKKPKATVKCQKKLCPIDCVMGEWKPRGKCSNQCGTGVRVFSRSVVEPARFGGRCPKQFKLTKNKPCRSTKGCASAEAKAQALAAAKASPVQAQAQAATKAPLTAEQQKKRLRNKRCLACKKGDFKCQLKNCMNKAQRNACKACKKGKDGKKCRAAKCRAVFQARRKTLKARKAARKAERKAAAAAKAASAPAQTQGKTYKWTHTPRNRRCLKCVKGDRKCKRANCMWKAERKACKACGDKKKCRKQKCRAVIRARREHLRRAAARRTRCMNCQKGQGKCKRQNCLTKAQLKECKTCAKGDAGKACRIEKCRGPANARRQHLIKTAKNNRCMKCAKQGRGAPECKFHNCLNKAQKADCKTCKEGDAKCREEKCRSVWRAQRKALFAAEAKAIAAKEAGQTSAKKQVKKAKKSSKKAKKAKKQAKKAKKQAKKAKKCESKCRSGKKGKKCRRACRERRAERRAAKKAAKAAEKAKAAAPVAPVAPVAPAAPAPAAAAPAPADDSMSPEVVIPKFRATSL